jgi:hypothetical protein
MWFLWGFYFFGFRVNQDLRLNIFEELLYNSVVSKCLC